MSTENEVFRKIKEMSTRVVNPRPAIPVGNIAMEMGISSEMLALCLIRLKDLRLVNFADALPTNIKLTLLGTVVKR